jgi:release factor glutamine methyltransferase
MSAADTLPVAAAATAGEALAATTAALRGDRSPTPRLDAEVLVAWAFERDRSWLLAHLDERLPASAAEALGDWTARRSRGEPIAYIRGFKEWYGLRLRTDPRALIPRPETELLVDAAIDELAERLVRDDRPILAWDLGTGSGAVSVALARRFRAALALGRLRLVASDVSPDAVELASENLREHGVEGLVALAVGDLLEPAPDSRHPDVVVANLPYVPTAEVEAGTGSLAWEPRLALDGGTTGTDLLNRLLLALPNDLAPDGVALVEIGDGQAAAASGIVAALPGRWTTEVRPDLAGRSRIVRVERQP